MTGQLQRSLWIAVYALLAAIGIGVLIFSLRGELSPAVEAILPIAYVVVLVIVVRRGLVTTGAGTRQPLKPFALFKASDLVKSLICFIAACLWAAIAGSLTSDTDVGNAIVVVPVLALLGIGAFFVGRSVFSWMRGTLGF